MRRPVIEVQCGRCQRTELLHPMEVTEAVKEAPPMFTASMIGQYPGDKRTEVRFDDLCAPCQKTVRALLQQIGKAIEGLSPDRKPRAAAPAAAPAQAGTETTSAAAPPAAPHPPEAAKNVNGATPARPHAKAGAAPTPSRSS